MVDKSSLNMLKGSEVDFSEELIGESFKIKNPKTKSAKNQRNSENPDFPEIFGFFFAIFLNRKISELKKSWDTVSMYNFMFFQLQMNPERFRNI